MFSLHEKFWDMKKDGKRFGNVWKLECNFRRGRRSWRTHGSGHAHLSSCCLTLPTLWPEESECEEQKSKEKEVSIINFCSWKGRGNNEERGMKEGMWNKIVHQSVQKGMNQSFGMAC